MARRRWVVKYDTEMGCWTAYPHDHKSRMRKGWVFLHWQDAMDYANSNGKRTDIPRVSPVRFK